VASIERRSENSYRITVSTGYDSKGKKLRKYKSVTLDPGLTERQKEKELQRLAAEFERQVQTGQFLDGNITLSSFADRWLEEYAEKQLQPKTLDSYKLELNSKILPALGHIRLDKLQPVHIIEFLNNLLEDGVRKDGKSGGYSDRTVKYQHQILSSILHTAVYWQVILSNPCERVKVPKNENKTYNDVSKIKHFTEEQTIRFLELAQESKLMYQVIAILSIYTGLRLGELLALTWDDIDTEAHTIDINKAYGHTPEKGMYLKATKNDGSNRLVSIPNNVTRLLSKYKVEQNIQRLKCGDLWDKAWDNNKLLFTQWNGVVMSYTTPFQWLKRTIRKYNKSIKNNHDIPDKEKEQLYLPEIPFHGLRHTSATLLIAEKVDVKTISSRLGHTQTSTTIDIYSHALRTADTKAASTLENLLDKSKGINSWQA